MYSNSTVLRGDEASAAAIFLSTDTSKVAADLWYEQARGAVNLLLRKPARLETVQALILLALRDYGKGGVAGGGESQAWLLIGMAIRLGQELDLPASASFSPNFTSLNMSNTEHITRGNLWGILTMLDGLLSLQLGRAPAVAEALKPKPNANLHIYPSTVDAPTPGTSSSPSVSGLPTSILSSPPPLFAYSCLLSQIISKINFWLYLGFGPTPSPPSAPGPTNSRVSSALLSLSSSSSGSVTPLSTAEPQNAFPTQAKLATLRTELDGWLQMLPIQFRVSIGGIGFGATGLGTKEVLEVNMLYHVAVILLYRPL
ncbi:hypothetical protein BDP27DRAFT_1232797 [Rhodocollybia butyracea]|uniref:Xylanolytic transcriptional activator regulatory domain-containing protein n=1 Tax=Rhodocollybia butyracea TaxID=206335 RepID=A0A9P5U0V5_9AGAR|nr:hypothetical protein BDP27DRAFT_1232797 [Rhodocollybia butyracea]